MASSERPVHGMVLRSAIALPALFAIAGALLVARHVAAQVVHPSTASSALTERDFSRMLPAMTAQAVGNAANDGNPHAGALPASALTTEDFKRMLPRTDMRSDADANAHPHAHAFLDSGTATPFDGASIARNPLASDAIAIGAKSCVACHALENVQASHSLHVQAFRAGAAGTGAAAACEACHGPGSAHAKDPTKPGLIIAFTRDAKTPIDTQTGVCLACHKGGARQDWIGSVHQQHQLSCTDGHTRRGVWRAGGVRATTSITGGGTIANRATRKRSTRRSHMPLPEGQMSCVDCHNPHGTLTAGLIKTDTVNQTCYACHAEKRGPFLFEHAPVRKDCLTCHDPHGSNQQALLTLPVPMLCQQCHTMTGHPNDLLTTAGLAAGPAPDERLIGRACLTCHANIHGSNNPSGSRFHK